MKKYYNKQYDAENKNFTSNQNPNYLKKDGEKQNYQKRDGDKPVYHGDNSNYQKRDGDNSYQKRDKDIDKKELEMKLGNIKNILKVNIYIFIKE